MSHSLFHICHAYLLYHLYLWRHHHPEECGEVGWGGPLHPSLPPSPSPSNINTFTDTKVQRSLHSTAANPHFTAGTDFIPSSSTPSPFFYSPLLRSSIPSLTSTHQFTSTHSLHPSIFHHSAPSSLTLTPSIMNPFSATP
ncbi:hypothetical protein E2C01_037273 [Portunus trituberculatus]|uniref:Uncharacterized protein n=1 Tax=Portunus trituberculatus TaxID=210409 RepID=A0A5B7FEW4_PORTR|nr:hypothetical protein [Portunus trituberculatus]